MAPYLTKKQRPLSVTWMHPQQAVTCTQLYQVGGVCQTAELVHMGGKGQQGPCATTVMWN